MIPAFGSAIDAALLAKLVEYRAEAERELNGTYDHGEPLNRLACDVWMEEPQTGRGAIAQIR